MTLEETMQLLKLVVAGDRRTIGPEDVQYWQAMLDRIQLQDAINALVMIRRREPDKWIDPGHIWNLCAVRTDAEAAERGLVDCEHGGICEDCKLVHRPDEPCQVLVAKPWPRALQDATRTTET